MNGKQKKLLHQSVDKNYMEVVDQGDTRSLYFSNDVIQSRISLVEPHTLQLKYTQYMMGASLLACPAPRSALLIGVGAGALIHFFNYFFPNCQLIGVDYSEQILKIAGGFFALPENENIRIYCDDGLTFLRQLSHNSRFDLILIDAFNDEGMAKTIYSNEFFKTAAEHLTAEGIICANLWSGKKDKFDEVQKNIRKHFVATLNLPVHQRENIISLIFQQSVPWSQFNLDTPQLMQLSKTFEQCIDFPLIDKMIKKHNLKLGERIQLWLS